MTVDVPSASPLIGRSRETEALLRIVQGASTAGGALVLRGEAGVGKSALLAHAAKVGEEAGMRVLSARGVPAETSLPFAGLHRLLGPLLGRAEALPQPLSRALLGAFGLVDGETPSIFRIGLAALNLLTDASSDQPSLAIADDLQWFDDASQQVLAFLARRLAEDPVVLLAAVRDGWPDAFREAEVPVLRLGGLPREDAERLLALWAPDLRGEARRRVLEWADGNPLALRELPLTTSTTDGAVSGSWTPLTERLERAFAGRLRELPDPTRALLLTAALHPGDDVAQIYEAARSVDPTAELRALDPAIAAGLVRVSGTKITFRHALVRSAVFQAADPHQRVMAHRALAEQASLPADQRVWHRLAASAGPDPALAGELQELSRTYVRRGALDAAVRALEQSAAMTSDESVRGERLLHAASLGLQVGRLDQVTSLLGQIEGLTLGPQAARRSRLLFWAGWPPAPGDPAGSLEVVDEALRSARDGDRDTAVELLLLAARTEAFAGREQSSAAHVVAALDAVGDRADDPRCLLIRAFASPLRSGSEVIRGAKSARSIELDADGLTSVAMACMWVHATNVAAPFLDRAADALRQRGDLLQLAELLVVRAWAGFFMGKWDNGITDAAEGGRLSRETQQPIYAAVLDVLHAMLLRLRGGDVDFPESMTAAERTGLSGGGAAVLNVVQLARGLASMAQGSYGTAFEQLVRIYAPQDPAYHRFHGCRWLTYLAEAAVHADRIADARAIVSEIEPLIELTDAEALHISLRYAHAVLADEAEAEQLYLRALSADLADWPLDQARLNLAWGAWLRRRRRAAESRDPLRRARDTFESIGAMYWAERARRELRAAGERSGDPAVQQKHGLTAQELQIAQLAAQGWSNREIGQQIYVSHRTVGSHLYRIFPKLGITSRQQLSQVLIDSR